MSDPRDELIAITRATRALLEWHQDCGAEGLPTAAHPVELPDLLRGGRKPRPRAQAAAPVQAPPIRSGPEPVATPGARPPAPSLEPSRPVVSPAPPPGPVAPSRAIPLESHAVPSAERPGRLSVIAERVATCTRCGLHATRKQTVFSRGSPDAELVFIGEGPGFDEDAQGLPFVGKAGQLLDKMIAAMGLGRDEVYVCNIVKCRPPDNRTPEASEMAACIPYLAEQLEIVRPKAMVALGSTAVRGLLGTTEGITKIRGSWRLYRGSVPVMPTFHPAYVLRQPTTAVRGMVWSDLQQVLKELGRSVPARGG
jgi:DNA polymerase